MIEGKSAKTRSISAGIPVVDLEMAKAYIQGAVHSHCNFCPDGEISVRLLFGGDNRDWEGTPLQVIYDYHHNMDGGKTHDKAAESAAKDVGHLLKKVLADDRRTFIY